ncbi:MAG TPA: glycosyltransferase [Bryobacteraceae bacterium]|nr:glycosyltransferase [Bryobacteraceae bacterium]
MKPKTIRVMAMLEPVSLAGTAKAVLEFARERNRRHPDLPEIDLSILNFSRGSMTLDTALKTAIEETGVPVDTVREQGRFDRAVFQQLHGFVASRRPDVIWSNSVKSHFLVRAGGLHRSRAWVAYHHGYTTTSLAVRLYNLLDFWSLRKADRVLTVCKPFAHDLVRRGVQEKRIRVQHMPIREWTAPAEGDLAEARSRLTWSAETRWILSVGRLSREKAHADLLRAFAQMDGALNTPTRLVLVGDGPERSALEELARTLGVAGSVQFAGHQTNVAPYYALADIFALPSHSEGSPNVLLEAMAAGVPVVATAVGGIPELATNNRDAVLVSKGNIAEMSSGLTALLTDEGLRVRLAGSARRTIASYTPEAYLRSIVSVFEEAILSRK